MALIATSSFSPPLTNPHVSTTLGDELILAGASPLFDSNSGHDPAEIPSGDKTE